MSYRILVVVFFMMTSMYAMKEEDTSEIQVPAIPAVPVENAPISEPSDEPSPNQITQATVTQPNSDAETPIEQPSEVVEPAQTERPTATIPDETEQIPADSVTQQPAPTMPIQTPTITPTLSTQIPVDRPTPSVTVQEPVLTTPIEVPTVTTSPITIETSPSGAFPTPETQLVPTTPIPTSQATTAAIRATPSPQTSAIMVPTPSVETSVTTSAPSVAMTPSATTPSVPEESAAIPSAPEETKHEIPEQEEPAEPEEDEIQGIDTMGLEEPRGNWLFKHIWWQRAEGRYDKIRQTVDQINDVYLAFAKKRIELDKTVLDPFYSDIGFKQGELQGLLTELIANLERERQSEGMLTEEKQELLASMQEEREFLQRLYRSSQNILLLDQTADKVLERVVEQIARVIHYEQEAWNHMREISRILSDKKARELYYRIDANWRNIKNIHQYIGRDLQHYFNQLITDAKTQVQRIKESVQALKEKGFDLKTQAQKPVEEQVTPAEEEEEEEIPTKPKPAKPKGILGYTTWIFRKISNSVLWIPRAIWRGVTSLFGWKR